MTVESFARLVSAGQPIIIEGAVVDMVLGAPWTPGHIVDVVGGKKVTPKRLVQTSTEWASLETASTDITVEQFAAEMHTTGMPIPVEFTYVIQ